MSYHHWVCVRAIISIKVLYMSFFGSRGEHVIGIGFWFYAFQFAFIIISLCSL